MTKLLDTRDLQLSNVGFHAMNGRVDMQLLLLLLTNVHDMLSCL